jgi:helicase
MPQKHVIEELVLSANQFEEFNPMQSAAIKKGFEKNLVVSAPTASGKTIIAELYMLQSVLNEGKKVIYTCPLRALASEHYNDFKKKYSGQSSTHNIKFAVSTGDLDSSSSYLKNFDVIMTTYEKCFPFDEYIICKLGNKLQVLKIGEFFEFLKEHSQVIQKGSQEVLVPKINTEALSFSNGKPAFSKIESAICIKNNKEKILETTIESGRRFLSTENHKLFCVKNKKLQKIEAKNSEGEYLATINNLSGALDSRIRELDLVDVLRKAEHKQFLCAVFDEIDFDELAALLTSEARTLRRAKQLAKYYVRQRKIPFDVAAKMKHISITALTGQRSDSLHQCERKVELSYEFGKLLGYFISEGNYDSSKGRKAVLKIAAFNDWVQKDIKTVLKKLRVPFSFSLGIFSISSAALYALFHAIGIAKREGKAIPDFAFFSPDEFNKGLVEGLFNGDGGPNPLSLDYSTRNKKLAYQLSTLLLRYKITTYIYPQKVKGYSHTYYRLNILGGKNIEKFKSLFKGLRPVLMKKINALASRRTTRESMLFSPPVEKILDKKDLRHINQTKPHHSAIYNGFRRKQRTNPDFLKNFCLENGLKDSLVLCQAPLGYLKVKKVKKTSLSNEVYNIQTKAGNYFLGNGVLVKNCASLLRHKAEWLNDVGAIIIDEIHELDSDRGPVLEIALTQLRINNPNLKILGLSATIPNAKELSEWLDAELVQSDYRPTRLREGVLLDNNVEYNDKTKEDGSLEEIIESHLKNKKQLLVFMNSRKRAETMAKKLSAHTKKFIEEKHINQLTKASAKALTALESPTEQCASLSETIKQGAAFHHAGLMDTQREIVEENFRNGGIKLLCSTTTLSAGVNTPADVVLIPTLYRFEQYGMELISVREYKQCAGRAGRPKFSTEGKSILIANGDTQKELFMEKFVNGQIENIESKLSLIPVLRTHILALIATDYIYDIKTIEKFFEKTLYAHQYQNMGELLDNVLEIIDDLIEYKFVMRKDDVYKATLLGKRVSDLFLDPDSAHELVVALSSKKTFTSLSYLYAWANCTEFTPWLNPPKKLSALLQEELSQRTIELPFKEEKVLYEPESMQKFFSALMLEHWINEKKEQELFADYGLAPGVLFGKTRILEWLSYSTIELSKVLGLEKHLLRAQKLGLRVKYGVREELLLLVELRGIGRVRARKLFNAGIKRPSDIASNLHKVEALLGKKVSDELAKQVLAKTKEPLDSRQQKIVEGLKESN